MTSFPEFPAALRFVGRPPLRVVPGLAGHAVLLMFWRLGCVHARQALRECAEIAAELTGEPFVWVAVHVPTCAAEQDDARLLRAVAGLPRQPLLAVDADGELARGFGFARLPAFVLADAGGSEILRGIGEPLRLRLRDAIAALCAEAKDRGTASATPFAPIAPPRLAPVPAAIAADGDRLWVALRGPGRLCEVGPDGRVRAVHTGFDAPAAVAVRGDQVFVADSHRHDVRMLSRVSGRIETVLGTGRRSTDRFGGGYGVQQGIAGPSGLAVRDGGLLVAMAGAHQVWQFDPETGAASAWQGTGTRGLCDDSERAALCEPHGIAVDDRDVFVADTGNGALRAIDRAHDALRTVAQDLARPMAVAVRGEDVYVAAGWRPAVLRVPRGGGEPVVVADASHGLAEPCGLAFAGDTLWIADAAAGCLFALDVPGGAVRRVDLCGLPAVVAKAGDDACLAAELRLLEFQDVELRIALPCAPDESIDAEAPCEVHIVDEGEPTLAAPRRAMANVRDGAAELLAPVGERGSGAWRVRVQATVRRGPDERSVVRVFRYVVPVAVGGAGAITGVIAPAQSQA